ncbi:hypothetical protein EH32_11090 [Erythrobacter litoralis]|uniref:Uncharacterized protein n=1 Tax=Erythrobacter litoralis TaxID=39960 RepID=A0A074N5K5_9SPHN|nr:hypothetical protein EH32_11090 [Erythrobacter litoralis]
MDATSISTSSTLGIGPDRGATAAASTKSCASFAAQGYCFGRNEHVCLCNSLQIVRSEWIAVFALLRGLPLFQQAGCIVILVPAIIHDGVMFATKKQEVHFAFVIFGALRFIPPRAVLPPSVNVANFGVADLGARILIDLDVRFPTIGECAIQTTAVQLFCRCFRRSRMLHLRPHVTPFWD